MAIGTDRYASRADTLLFIACVALSIAALSLPDQWRDPLAQGLRQSVLAPFLFLQRQTELLAAARYRHDPVVAVACRGQELGLALQKKEWREHATATTGS